MATLVKPERKTISFSHGEVSQIEGLIRDESRKEILGALLAEKGLGSRALARVHSFSDAARLLIQLSLWELRRTSQAVAYRQTAEGMARVADSGAARDLAEASRRATEKALPEATFTINK